MTTLKNATKKFLKKFPGVRRFLINRRVAEAEAFLREGNLYGDILPELIQDYRYSISVTHRGVLQVVNLEEVIQYVVQKGIKGAFVECGVYTGGASAFSLRSLMRNNDGGSRPYWGFDSFEGMPEPSTGDGSDAYVWMYGKPTLATSGKLVGSDVNLAQYDACLAYLKGTGYPEAQIHLIKGWFQDTVKQYSQKIGPISVLRIDGDLYESTKIPLEGLFDNVVSGGAIILDDYGGFVGSRKATDEFLQSRGIDPFIHYVERSVRFFIKP